MKFSKEHEWLKPEGDYYVVGITDFAQHALGDIVYVELPKVGAELKAGDGAAVVESVKAASDVYAPISGTVLAVNDTLTSNSALVNTAPETDGWFFHVKPSNPAELDALMDEAAYKAFVQGLG